MNQPDHSRPNYGDGGNKLPPAPPPTLIFLSFLSTTLKFWQGCGTTVVFKGTPLELVVKLGPSARIATLTFKVLQPKMGSSPDPGWMPHTLSRGHDWVSSSWAHPPGIFFQQQL